MRHLLDENDPDAYAIQQYERRQRAYKNELNAHPHCSDPYHPGCALCDYEYEEGEDE